MPKITEHSNNQLRITIPRKLALAVGLRKGDLLEFKINRNGRLELVNLNKQSQL